MLPSDESLFDSEEKSSLLLRFVLDLLHKIFLYDTQSFLSKERADALMGPLLDQVRVHLSRTCRTFTCCEDGSVYFSLVNFSPVVTCFC